MGTIEEYHIPMSIVLLLDYFKYQFCMVTRWEGAAQNVDFED